MYLSLVVTFVVSTWSIFCKFYAKQAYAVQWEILCRPNYKTKQIVYKTSVLKLQQWTFTTVNTKSFNVLC